MPNARCEKAALTGRLRSVVDTGRLHSLTAVSAIRRMLAGQRVIPHRPA